jgi:hypothetical protein
LLLKRRLVTTRAGPKRIPVCITDRIRIVIIPRFNAGSRISHS